MWHKISQIAYHGVFVSGVVTSVGFPCWLGETQGYVSFPSEVQHYVLALFELNREIDIMFSDLVCATFELISLARFGVQINPGMR